ncbi:MAG: hypothetical protein ACPGLV_08920 [Bacteroidia bacterium]
MPKALLNKILWAFAALFVIMGASYGNKKVKLATINQVQVNIAPTQQGNFISETDITDRINAFYTPSLLEQKTKDIDILQLDSIVESSPFVKSANSFSSLNGKLFVEIEQELPLIRIHSSKVKGYYISYEGKKLPLSMHKAARVPVVTGNITETITPDDTLKTQLIKDLYSIALYLDKNAFFKALTGQLHVENNGDIVLITKSEERHDIILGNAQNLESKFDNLYQFYTKVLSIKGWDRYRTINLKFKNQIVAK